MQESIVIRGLNPKHFKVDLILLQRKKEIIEKEKEFFRKELHKLVPSLKPQSPKSVQTYFKGKGFISKTKSYGSLFLKELYSKGIQEAGLILGIRSKVKILSQVRQIEKEYFKNKMVPTSVLGMEDGKLRTVNPSLGQISLRLRDCFVANKGKSLLSLSFSRISFLVLAYLSQESVVTGLMIEKGDILKNISEVIGMSPNVIESLMLSKLRNLSVEALTLKIGTDSDTALDYLSCFDYYFPRMSLYIRKGKREFLKKESVTTHIDKRVMFGDFFNSNKEQKGSQGICLELYGTIADLLSHCLLDGKLKRYFKERNISVVLVNGFTIIVECNKEIANSARNYIQNEWKIVSRKLGFPQVISTKIGKNWKELSKRGSSAD